MKAKKKRKKGYNFKALSRSVDGISARTCELLCLNSVHFLANIVQKLKAKYFYFRFELALISLICLEIGILTNEFEARLRKYICLSRFNV